MWEQHYLAPNAQLNIGFQGWLNPINGGWARAWQLYRLGLL
jgi:hypothetical protein